MQATTNEKLTSIKSQIEPLVNLQQVLLNVVELTEIKSNSIEESFQTREFKVKIEMKEEIESLDDNVGTEVVYQDDGK